MNKEIEELRDKILAIQEGVTELKETGIRENILHIAIQKSAMTHYQGKPIRIFDIKMILEGIETLDSYLFPKEQT